MPLPAQYHRVMATGVFNGAGVWRRNETWIRRAFNGLDACFVPETSGVTLHRTRNDITAKMSLAGRSRGPLFVFGGQLPAFMRDRLPSFLRFHCFATASSQVLYKLPCLVSSNLHVLFIDLSVTMWGSPECDCVWCETSLNCIINLRLYSYWNI